MTRPVAARVPVISRGAERLRVQELAPMTCRFAAPLLLGAFVVACSGGSDPVASESNPAPGGSATATEEGTPGDPQKDPPSTDPNKDPGKDPVVPTDPKNPAPPAAAGDPCVPVSTSGIVPRVGGIAARIEAHQKTPPTPANGSVNVSKASNGKPSYISYDAQGTGSDYTESFSYDSGGRLTYFSHNADGSGNDYTESYSYDSAGLVTYFSHNHDGTGGDWTESFSYDSGGRLTYFS